MIMYNKKYSIDLRFAVPPLVKLLHHLIIQLLSQRNPLYSKSDQPIMLINKVTPTRLTLCFFFFFFFLVVSVRLPLTLSVLAEPIRLRFGDRFCFSGSGLLAVALLLAPFVLPPSLFWHAYFISICIAPWSGMLCNMLHRRLRPVPTLLITFTTTQQQQPEEDEEETTSTTPPHPGSELLQQQQQPTSSSPPPPTPPEFELNENGDDEKEIEHEHLQIIIHGGHA